MQCLLLNEIGRFDYLYIKVTLLKINQKYHDLM